MEHAVYDARRYSYHIRGMFSIEYDQANLSTNNPQAILCHLRRMRALMIFKYRRRVQEAVFVCWNRVHLRKVAQFCIYKRSLVITEVVCCDILKAFAMEENQKSRDELNAN